MERLHQENDLANFLKKQRRRGITIVSAFASASDLLETIHSHNHVEMILGTINAFTSPKFIDKAKGLLQRRLWVDFRGNASIHWKLYLISPNTVVIGSANFTNQGVGLGQDTCVVIRNTDLYNDYLQQVDLLKKNKQVLTPGSPAFDAALERHREQHERNQAALQAAQQAARNASGRPAARTPSFEEWTRQGFVSIPLFVWDHDHGPAAKKEASRMLRDADAESRQLTGDTGKSAVPARNSYRDFLSERIKGPSAPFIPGTIVLATNRRGAHMRFMQLDVIARSTRRKCDFMIERRKARYPRPFEITPAIKAAITRLIEKGEVDDYAIPVDALQAELRND